MVKLVPKFCFHWSRKNDDDGTDHYIWKKGQLGEEDQASYDRLVAFIGKIPPPQRGKGGRMLTIKDGNFLYEPVLILVKELLESEDSLAYLGCLLFISTRFACSFIYFCLITPIFLCRKDESRY